MIKRRILLLNNHRSQGHIEMILSFIIFVGFVFTLFIFFTPVRQDTVSYASLEKTQTSLLSRVSINYNYVSIILNSTYRGSCISVNDIPSAEGNVIVKDLSGNILTSKRTAGNGIDIRAYGDRYYQLYFSSLFSPSSEVFTDCGSLVKNINYSEVVVSFGEDIFYEKINDTQNYYLTNYNELKTELGLLNDFEFLVYNFSYAVLMNETISFHKTKSFSVLSRDIPIRALTKTGEYKDLILTIRVWK